MRTRVATATGLLCIGVLLLAACGGGSSTFAAPTGQMGVTMFSPGGTIQSEAQQPFMILGQGFGPVGDPCPIRVTATSGTPFRMGTSATLEGPGYIEASDCIRGVLEAAQILPTTGPVTATVDLILPDGSTFPLEGVTATFAELDYQLKILSISPDAGAAWGYEQVTLQGCGFSRYDPGTPRVWFGGREATEVVVQSDTTLTCRTAPNALGFVDVRIANDYADFELISGFEHPWLCAWDWEYGARHAGLSNRDHPYYNYPCPAGFRFSWRGGLASNIRISGGWIYPYVPGVGHQGTIGHLGSCLDTWAPDANI
ncbi:MAG: IPT/TIG domain-containing protein, partial [Planctomycetota bacterium]|nr:IPT/TIG domain-containing protein [Planctomycetota bacterium]